MFENRKAKKDLEALKAGLVIILDDLLRGVKTIQDPVTRIVGLFNVVAPWYDAEQRREKSADCAPSVGDVISALKKTNRSEYAETIKALETLQAHIINAGRNKYGMNRTAPGEMVTLDNVYLGDVFGRWTFTAREWQNSFNKEGPDAQEDKRIIEAQAANFVDSHLGPMQEIIDSLRGNSVLPRPTMATGTGHGSSAPRP